MSDFTKLKTRKNGKEYILNVCTQDTEQNIIGTKNFTKLTVNSKNVVTSINGLPASENGNVVLETASSGVGFPDYNAGITLSIDGSPTEVPSDGWVYMTFATNGKSSTCTFSIYTDKKNYPNNKLCSYTYGFSTSAWATDHANVTVLIPIKKGQAVTLSASHSVNFVFYPFEQ